MKDGDRYATQKEFEFVFRDILGFDSEIAANRDYESKRAEIHERFVRERKISKSRTQYTGNTFESVRKSIK